MINLEEIFKELEKHKYINYVENRILQHPNLKKFNNIKSKEAIIIENEIRDESILLRKDDREQFMLHYLGSVDYVDETLEHMKIDKNKIEDRVFLSFKNTIMHARENHHRVDFIIHMYRKITPDELLGIKKGFKKILEFYETERPYLILDNFIRYQRNYN